MFKLINNTKIAYFIFGLTFLTCSLVSCSKFLNVESESALSGNNFFKTPDDFEKYMGGIYNQFRTYTMSTAMFFVATGDYRSAPYIGVTNRADRDYLMTLPNNDLLSTLQDRTWSSMFTPITDWSSFFKIIASCNILIDNLNKEDGELNEQQIKQYKGEAVFMRNLCYFFMARLYGNIPYYTDAYHTAPLVRENMVSVLNKCIKDMSSATNDLPWTYVDPSKVGVRAMRGSALDLLMHMNMWCATFDQANAEKYWNATDSLGKVLLNDNQGAYELLPYNDFRAIFLGGSKEGLFEIEQDVNKGETFTLKATYADDLMHAPYKNNAESFGRIDSKFMETWFPKGQADLRANGPDPWFQNIYSDNFSFMVLKYIDVAVLSQGAYGTPNDNQIVFRLPDAILLRAEALDHLGNEAEAIKMLNLVRDRAGAADYHDGETAGWNLSDAIFNERCKELVGEGYYYYDLVRTKRILDSKFCAHPISAEAFSQGAWTWPISKNALTNSPGMTLNTYWQ